MHLVPASPGARHTAVAGPETHPLDRLRFELLRLEPGESYDSATDDYELGLVVLGGTVDVHAAESSFANVGSRPNVFAGRATAVYVPPRTRFQASAGPEVGAEVALCFARSSEGGPVTLVTPADVVSREVGRANWRRRVEDLLATAPATSLLLGETYNPPGNWSSYPPHKHDVESPGEEVALEEIYHYRLAPPQGFGVQCVYTEEGDVSEACIVRNGDTVAIPRGYHPVVAAPGYSLYYLWMLSGPIRVMRPRDDPRHAWVKAVEAMLPPGV